MPALPVRPLIGISTDFYAPKNSHPHLRLNAGYPLSSQIEEGIRIIGRLAHAMQAEQH